VGPELESLALELGLPFTTVAEIAQHFQQVVEGLDRAELS
jgi:hypothetical protein